MVAAPRGDRQTSFVLRVVSASSRDPDRGRAAAALARELADRLGGRPAAAAIFFASSSYGPGFGAFESAIASGTGAPHVVGCSAHGVLGPPGDDERGAAVAALAIGGDVEAQRFFLSSLRGRAHEVGREIGRAANALDSERRAVLLLADSYNLAPDELLAGVDATAPGVTVFGAGATEDGATGETSVIGRGASSSNAVVGLALGGLTVTSAVARACVAVSPWRVVTRSDCNRVLEIDGRPALEVFLESVPATLREDPASTIRSTLCGIADPLDAKPDPDFLIRRFVGIDERRHALSVGDEVVAGSRIAIVVRDPGAARRSLQASLEDVLAIPGLAGTLVFNDLERGEALYGLPGHDAAYLRRHLGDLALAGLFGSVAFAPLRGRNRFHQYAAVVVGLSDDDAAEESDGARWER
jgi:small ligand-binding sensory domain FIST